MLALTYAIPLGIALLAFILASIYRIVPADSVDVVIQGSKVTLYSPHKAYSTTGKSTYFRIPEWFFLFGLGMRVHRIPLKIITINVPNFLAFDQDRARFVCDIICYVTVKDPLVAAQRFSGDLTEMSKQVSMIVQATTRDVTTKKPIRAIINNRDDIISAIKPILQNTIIEWGLDLKDIELIDFKDPTPTEDGIKSHVIEDISTIIETQINSEMRQKNAAQNKDARMREAENDEEAKKRELSRDEAVRKRAQEVEMVVFAQQKLAREQELEVTKVQQVKTAEIEKDKQIVQAQQRQQVEAINKEQKRLMGEGDRAQKEQQAIGDAAHFREEGLAQAAAKEKLQEALNKFKPEAIRALVAEAMVAAWKDVGVAGAKALEGAEVKVLAGGSPEAFNTGTMIESIRTSSPQAALAAVNKIARSLDLGFTNLYGQEPEPGKESKETSPKGADAPKKVN